MGTGRLESHNIVAAPRTPAARHWWHLPPDGSTHPGFSDDDTPGPRAEPACRVKPAFKQGSSGRRRLISGKLLFLRSPWPLHQKPTKQCNGLVPGTNRNAATRAFSPLRFMLLLKAHLLRIYAETSDAVAPATTLRAEARAHKEGRLLSGKATGIFAIARSSPRISLDLAVRLGRRFQWPVVRVLLVRTRRSWNILFRRKRQRQLEKTLGSELEFREIYAVRMRAEYASRLTKCSSVIVDFWLARQRQVKYQCG